MNDLIKDVIKLLKQTTNDFKVIQRYLRRYYKIDLDLPSIKKRFYDK